TGARRPLVGSRCSRVPRLAPERWVGVRSLVAGEASLAATDLVPGPMSQDAAQPTVAALHDQAPRHENTDRRCVLVLGFRREQGVDLEETETRSVAAATEGGTAREPHSFVPGASTLHAVTPPSRGR